MPQGVGFRLSRLQPLGEFVDLILTLGKLVLKIVLLLLLALLMLHTKLLVALHVLLFLLQLVDARLMLFLCRSLPVSERVCAVFSTTCPLVTWQVKRYVYDRNMILPTNLLKLCTEQS